MRARSIPAFALVGLFALSACGGSDPAPKASKAPAAAAGPLAHLAFMTGEWVTDDLSVDEVWLAPRGETMVGIGRTVRDGRTTFFEYLRVEVQDGTPVLLASPNGKSPAVPFKQIESSSTKVVFFNPEHDDPKRVTYEREGEGLRATTEGTSIQSYRMRRR